MLQTKVEAVPSAHLCWDPKDLLSWEWVSFHEVPYQLKQILIRKFNWLGTEDQFILRRQQRWFREHASLLVPSPFPTLDYEWGRHTRDVRVRGVDVIVFFVVAVLVSEPRRRALSVTED